MSEIDILIIKEDMLFSVGSSSLDVISLSLQQVPLVAFPFPITLDHASSNKHYLHHSQDIAVFISCLKYLTLQTLLGFREIARTVSIRFLVSPFFLDRKFGVA